MKNYKELGNRYFASKKIKSALIITSIVLATILIYIIMVLGANYFKNGKAEELRYANYNMVVFEPTKEQVEALRNHPECKNVDMAIAESYVDFYDLMGFEAFELISFESPNQSTFKYDITQGRFPKSSNEIMINEYALGLFAKEVKVGDVIKTYDDKRYIISGVYEREDEDEYNRRYAAFSIADKSVSLNAYVEFDCSGNWEETADRIIRDVGIECEEGEKAYSLNYSLGKYYLQGNVDNTILVILALFFVLFVVYICMIMIRSLFSTNMIEKIRDFSVLKSMGADKTHLKKIFTRECYLQTVIAFVIGVVLSHIIIQGIFINILKITFISFDFSIIALVISAIIIWLTITLAIIEPFSILKKISIVEGIGENYVLKNVKMKKRGGKIFRIFGIEGEYAYKNLRRNGSSFWKTITAFTISVLLLTVLVTAMDNLVAMLKDEMGFNENEGAYDIMLEGMFEYLNDSDKVVENLKAKDYVTQVHNIYQTFSFGDYQGSNVCGITFCTDEQLDMMDKYMQEGVSAREATKDGGAVFVKYEDYTAKIGDNIELISLERMRDYMKENEYDNLLLEFYKSVKDDPEAKDKVEIKGLANCGLINIETGCPEIIMSYSYWENRLGNEFMSNLNNGTCVNIDDSKFDRVDFSKTLMEGNVLGWTFMDPMRMAKEEIREIRLIIIGIAIFVFIMGLVNILHSMINEQMTRKREISLLRAIGMSKNQLCKMLILEKIIVGIIAWVIGTGLGVGVVYLFMGPLSYMSETPFVFSFADYGLIFLGMLGLMLILAWVMIRSLGNRDMTEGIRNID